MSPFSRDDDKTKIVVCGYPKSGNTWLTRLVAELVEAPVGGFLDAPEHKEIATEGIERESNYTVYKSHHDGHEISSRIRQCDKTIHIIRDPRDVAISASNFFHCHRWPRARAWFAKQPLPIRILDSRFVYPLFHSKDYKRKRCINAVLYGDPKVHFWLSQPWRKHFQSFNVAERLVVRYEDLLINCAEECRRILKYLGLRIEEKDIEEAIERQSFRRKKNTFILSGEKSKSQFMKEGRSKQWQTNLTDGEKQLFVNEIGQVLSECGYADR
jgi:hypothetical protein